MLVWVLLVLLNQVEIDELISGDLDPDVSLDIVDETSSLNLIILFPLSGLGLLVELKFEEKDVTGASGDQGLIINQVHLPKIHFSHSVKGVITALLGVNDEGLALSVERVNLILLFIIEAPVREVFLGADQLLCHDVSIHCLAAKVVDKVVVFTVVIVE